MATLENPRWEIFCIELVTNGKNLTQAAIAAGYSEKTACAQANRLLKNVKVLARAEELKAELKSAKIADAQEVLETLTRIIRREEKEQQVVVLSNRIPTIDDKSGKTKYTTKQEAQLVEITPPIATVNKAAELLGKYHTLFTDKVAMDGAMPVTIVDNVPPPKEQSEPKEAQDGE